MSGIDLLAALPSSLVGVILGQFLEIEHIARLESACCNHVTREHLLESLQFPACIFEPRAAFYDDDVVEHSMRWIIKRKIQVSYVLISENADALELKHLLGYAGSALKSVSFIQIMQSDRFEAFFHELQQYTSHIKICGFIDCVIPDGLKEYLSGMHELQTLILQCAGSKILNSDSFSEMNCPNLKSVLIMGGEDWSECTVSFANMFTNIGQSLVGLRLCGLEMTDECAITIARLCPNIRVLSLLGGGIASPEAVMEMCSLCPSIAHIELNFIDDECVIHIAETLKLHTLCLKACDLLTDASLSAIRQHQHHTLVSLTLLEAARCSPYALTDLLQHCTQLRYLEFGSDLYDYSSFLTDDVISHLSGIETLCIVCTKISIRNETIDSIINHCAGLRHLCIDTPKQLLKSLTTLVKNCPNLNTLQLKAVNLKKIDTWEAINSNLLIEDLDREVVSDAFQSQFLLQAAL